MAGVQRIELKYGSGTQTFEVPAERLHGVWSLPRPEPSSRDHWGWALEELREAGWDEAVRDRRLAILVPDGTREWDPSRLLPPLAPLVTTALEVTVFVCTGTHAADAAYNLSLIPRIGRALAGVGAGESVVADARRDRYVPVGTTSRGTPVELHERLHSCELFLILSDVKHHYFAGYSNPAKYLVPGLASLATVRANHSLALDEASAAGCHPWHSDPERHSNPLAADLVEAFELGVAGRPCYALTTVTAGSEILWAGGGPAAEAARRAFDQADARAEITVPPARFLVVSPGGHPHDESAYTAQRALELTRAAVRPGGEVLFLARCAEGWGPPGTWENAFEPLTGDLQELLRGAARITPDTYRLYGHKPIKLARLLTSLEHLWMTSDLPPEDLRRIHIAPAPDPADVVRRWIEACGPGEGVAFVDDASKLCLRADPADRAAPGQVPIE